jgi:RNA polymerase sigma-70 factor, ECF subfamily
MDQKLINELVKRAQEKDPSAFAELIGQTRRFAYATACRITGNPEDSKDIVQEAFIRVWNNFHRYSGQVTFQTWLFSILRNLSIDWLRKNRSRQAAFQSNAALSDNNHPGAQLEASELTSLIGLWLRKLPETQQLIFMLRDIDGLTIREVEAQTGLTEASIKSNLYVARKKLAAFLNRNGYPIP